MGERKKFTSNQDRPPSRERYVFIASFFVAKWYPTFPEDKRIPSAFYGEYKGPNFILDTELRCDEQSSSIQVIFYPSESKSGASIGFHIPPLS